jgi:hypothetical protein
MSLDQVVYQFLLKKSRSNQWSLNTYKAYENDLKQWLWCMHRQGMFDLNNEVKSSCHIYLCELIETHPSHTTYQRKRKVLKLFNDYCVSEHGISVVEEMVPQKTRAIISSEINDKTILEYLFSIGIDEVSLCRLTPQHFNTKTGVIQFDRNSYQLTADVLMPIATWLSTKDREAFLFPYNKKALKALLRQRDLKKISEDTPEVVFIPDYRMYHPRG